MGRSRAVGLTRTPAPAHTRTRLHADVLAALGAQQPPRRARLLPAALGERHVRVRLVRVERQVDVRLALAWPVTHVCCFSHACPAGVLGGGASGPAARVVFRARRARGCGNAAGQASAPNKSHTHTLRGSFIAPCRTMMMRCGYRRVTTLRSYASETETMAWSTRYRLRFGGQRAEHRRATLPAAAINM